MRRPILAAVLACWAAPALADKIDGQWCADDGRNFSIDGPRIVTETGAKLTGNYGRHSFSYLVPPPQAQAGEVVQMILANELTLYRRVGPAGPAEVWKRCSPTS